MRRIIMLVVVALVMAAMMVAMAMPAFAAPQFVGSPGDPGHPTCTKAEPHSPAIEPGEGGSCFRAPQVEVSQGEVSPSSAEH
jgi:hypothetical protein